MTIMEWLRPCKRPLPDKLEGLSDAFEQSRQSSAEIQRSARDLSEKLKEKGPDSDVRRLMQEALERAAR